MEKAADASSEATCPAAAKRGPGSDQTGRSEEIEMVGRCRRRRANVSTQCAIQRRESAVRVRTGQEAGTAGYAVMTRAVAAAFAVADGRRLCTRRVRSRLLHMLHVVRLRHVLHVMTGMPFHAWRGNAAGHPAAAIVRKYRSERRRRNGQRKAQRKDDAERVHRGTVSLRGLSGARLVCRQAYGPQAISAAR